MVKIGARFGWAKPISSRPTKPRAPWNATPSVAIL